MVLLDFRDIQLKLKQEEGKVKVFDPIRKKWLVLTPEEHVRQYLLQYMITNMQYPASLISVEKTIVVGNMDKRFDIIVYNRDHKPWMLVECKNPEIPVTENTLHQLLAYHSAVPCPYWLLTNGHETHCADARDTSAIKWVSILPSYPANK